MLRRILLCVAAVAVGCGPVEEQPAEDQPPSATSDALAGFAGTWTLRGLAESSDSVLITYELNATATRDGWTSTLPGREPMPVRIVLVDGDSVVAEAGPFESALRPGTTVTTQTVLRRAGDMLTGNIRARYSTAGADSVLIGRLHGTRRMQ